jgi:hypothetical protein
MPNFVVHYTFEKNFSKSSGHFTYQHHFFGGFAGYVRYFKKCQKGHIPAVHQPWGESQSTSKVRNPKIAIGPPILYFRPKKNMFFSHFGRQAERVKVHIPGSCNPDEMTIWGSILVVSASGQKVQNGHFGRLGLSDRYGTRPI